MHNGAGVQADFFVFSVIIWLFQHYLLREFSFPSCEYLGTFPENYLPCMCGCIWGYSVSLVCMSVFLTAPCCLNHWF